MLLKARAAPSRLEELGCKAKLYSLFNNDLMLCGLFARFYGKMYEYIQNTITISLKNVIPGHLWCCNSVSAVLPTKKVTHCSALNIKPSQLKRFDGKMI